MDDERNVGEAVRTDLLRVNYGSDDPLSAGSAVLVLCDEVDRLRAVVATLQGWVADEAACASVAPPSAAVTADGGG